MYSTNLYIAIVVGLILSLIYVEKTGIVPAGLIVPGYLALVLDQPVLILIILGMSFLTYLIVMKGITRFTILYGRRKFAAMLIVALLMKLGLDRIYPVMPFQINELSGVGVVVPGLIANSIQKQGLVHTVSSTLLLSGLTFLIIYIYFLF